MTTALLTGCTGWLGRSIVPFFAERYDCDVLSRRPGTNLTGDARSVVFPRKYDVIVHGALDGAQNILDQAGDAKVLFLSSGAVYARNTPYADAKRRDEAIMRDTDATIARLFCFIGPNMPEHYAAGEFLARLRDGRDIKVRGDGRTVRSYLHVDALPPILEGLLDYGPAIMDVGSTERVTILDLALRIAQYGHLNVTTSDVLVNPVDSYVPAPGAFGGYAIDLEDAIERSLPTGVPSFIGST